MNSCLSIKTKTTIVYICSCTTPTCTELSFCWTGELLSSITDCSHYDQGEGKHDFYPGLVRHGWIVSVLNMYL